MAYDINDASRDITRHEAEIKVLHKDVDELKRTVKENKESYDSAKNNCFVLFVSKEQFIPIRNVVYALVGTILLSVLGALLSLVIRR